MATSGKSSGRKSKRLTSSAEGSPASRFLWPESERELQTSAISGLRCYALLETSGHAMSWARMFLGSEITSTRYALTWKPRATKSSRLRFRLRLSELRTCDTGCSLWPTLTARDARTVAGCQDRPNRRGGKSLLPTLTANSRSGLQSHGKNAFLGQLNPRWTEWFMGLPENWTDLDALEMR